MKTKGDMMSNSKPLPKNRLQDRLLRDRQDDVGVGQPNKEPKPMSPDKNSLMGYKSASTNTRNHNKNQADTMNNTGLNVTQKHGILGSTVSLGTSKTPLRENKEIIISSGTVALIEQLLTEAANHTITTNIIGGGAGAIGEGKGIPPRTVHQPSTKDYGDAVRAKTQINDSDQNKDAKNAAAVKPQITTRGETIGLTQAATNQNATSKSSTNQRQQEKWEASQQG